MLSARSRLATVDHDENWRYGLGITPKTSLAVCRSDVERRALVHLMMIRAHLESIRRTAIAASKESLVGPWSALAARQSQLDIRFVVEEMLLLSVAAHQQAGETVSKSIRKEYRAGVIVKRLAQLNPNFFPIAISVFETDEPEVSGRFAIREGRHLTAELAVEYWNKSGDVLHANSKGLSQRKISDCLVRAEEFMELSKSLLETFEVDVSGKGMWIGGHLHFGEDQAPELFYASASA